MILGYVFSPLAFAIGVPWAEAVTAGSYIGQKFVLNEFVAYSAFAPEIANLSPKTVIVVSFALCGFANLSSMAILLGGLGALAPNRRSDIAKLDLR
ncbi:NupC/NupG family nucleoside CNT transporter, partial [Leptospira santarosai]|nr:NupC/NupG family nucleoside CNT transporter [Leptospira santarosai]